MMEDFFSKRRNIPGTPIVPAGARFYGHDRGRDELTPSGNGGGGNGNAGGAQLSSGMTTGHHAAFRYAKGGIVNLL